MLTICDQNSLELHLQKNCVGFQFKNLRKL